MMVHASMLPARGCWVTLYLDYSGMAIFDDELEAHRHAVANHMEVRWWPFGATIAEAVEAG